MIEIVFSTATALADAIRHKQITAVELLDAHLAHIAKHNPSVNAIVTLDEEGAIKRAKAADAALARGEIWGPLHGVAVTLEDWGPVGGMRSTVGGHPDYADFIPTQDSTVCAKLRQAGAIILGRTNITDLWENNIFGRTNNPWDLARTPGGTSGGGAAAIAAGLIPLAIGSDAGGSILGPAAFCGVFGMRPTEHRVSNAGALLIGAGRTWQPFSVWGPFARSVEDLALALQVIVGPDGLDMDVPPLGWRNVREVNLKDLRIAWSHTIPTMPLAKDIYSTIEKLAAELGRLGAQVEQALPGLDYVRLRSFVGEFLSYAYRDMFVAFGWVTADAPPVTMEDYLKAVQQRERFIAAWEQFFTQWDVLLCPFGMHTATRHAETQLVVDGQVYGNEEVGDLHGISPITGLPSVVIPVGKDSQGLPIGLQLVGRRWEDERLLAITKQIADVAGGFQRPAGY